MTEPNSPSALDYTVEIRHALSAPDLDVQALVDGGAIQLVRGNPLPGFTLIAHGSSRNERYR